MTATPVKINPDVSSHLSCVSAIAALEATLHCTDFKVSESSQAEKESLFLKPDSFILEYSSLVEDSLDSTSTDYEIDTDNPVHTAIDHLIHTLHTLLLSFVLLVSSLCCTRPSKYHTRPSYRHCYVGSDEQAIVCPVEHRFVVENRCEVGYRFTSGRIYAIHCRNARYRYGFRKQVLWCRIGEPSLSMALQFPTEINH